MPITKLASHEMHIAYINPEELKPYKNNARTHSDKQIQQIANSLKQFGFMNPVLIDSNNRIMAGHGRVEAAKKLGMKEVPVISSSHLSENQIRAYIIADNKIASNAGWDKNLLSIELKELSIETNFDIEITGFEMAEIDLIIDSDEPQEADPADEIPDIDNSPAITKLGDIWQLGQHILICGNALKNETYDRLLDTERADMVFTDPPYNVPIDGHVCGNGKIKHAEFAMASGEMTDAEFYSFLEDFCDKASSFSRDGSLHYICMDWRHIDVLIRAGKEFYADLKNICVWNKDNGGMGSLYRSKHELVAVFKHGKKPHINNIELGKHGRYRTNVWDYKGVNSFGRNQSDLKLHPTVKPVTMIADAIKDCTKRGHIVLDPFAGSGSTLIAAEKTGRIARCIELDPKYCDVIVRRWQKLTGEEALNDAFDSFDEVANSKL
ncbi:MAG: site-specific DNA-methyltransferase [Proteobacteria bacterium]|nr:site-specific DNA-methyltransferase [Pseudomonadota bacterium]MDA0967368.1 site-specific DNA-methyltransferase [Pseudomonadota bacterium]